MGRIPDSPEGVALALVTLILGVGDWAAPRDEELVRGLFRRCLSDVRDLPSPFQSDESVSHIGPH